MAMTKERLEEIKRRRDQCRTWSEELDGEHFDELIAEVERLQAELDLRDREPWMSLKEIEQARGHGKAGG